MMEETYEGGNIHGHDAIVFLVCQRGQNTASWVLAAAEHCAGGAICGSKRLKSLPAFFGPSQDKGRIEHFNLLKFTKGTGCHVISTREGSLNEPSEPAYSASKWFCERFDTYNGLKYDGDGETDMTFSGRASKPFILTTVGPSPAKEDRDNSTKVIGIAFSPDKYTVDWVTEIINPTLSVGP